MKKFLFLILALFVSFQAYSVTRIYDRSTGDIIDADKDDAEFDNTNNAINTHTADTSAHDATGGVVGVSKTQTLTNKTLTSPVITDSPTAAGATWTNLGTVTTFAATSGNITNLNIGTATHSGDLVLNSGADLNVYSGSGTPLKASIDGATGDVIMSPRTIGTAINCEINYSAGTITISGRGGVALSATNPCHIGIRSNSNGVVATATFTANITTTDGAASDTDGNTLGTTASTAWANAMPIFFGVIYDGTTPYFGFSRKPLVVSGSANTDLAQEGDTDGDGEGDFFIMTSGLTLASWVNLPITQVAWLTATKDASDQWTFAESAYTGFNTAYETQRWLLPQGQQGSAASSHFQANGGTAPVFTTDVVSYNIEPNGHVRVDAYATGDGGTDGAGAVAARMSLPFTFPSGNADDIWIPTGLVEGATTLTSGPAGVASIAEGTNYISLRYLDANNAPAAVTNAMFSNGTRNYRATVTYPTLVN